MAGLIERLRNKPPKTRKRVAFGTSAAVTSLIFVMWLTVLNHGFVDNGIEAQQLDTNTTQQTASPLSAFSDNAATAFRELKNSFREIEGATTSPATTTTSTDAEATPGRTPRTGGSQENPGGYWAGSASVSASQEVRNDPNDTEENEESDQRFSEQEDEPFTSRNYDPSQESDWFAE